MTKEFLDAENPYEIGSYFYFSQEELDGNTQCLNPLNPEYTYLSTCRSAINEILSKTKNEKKIALLPAFTCHAVVEPFVKNGYDVVPYPINRDFLTSADEFLDVINKVEPDVVLIHDYFGFDSNKGLRDSGAIQSIEDKGTTVIIDQTQSMFSEYPQLQGNYVVGSIRKWLGVPDGAFTNIKIDNLEEDSELIGAKCSAMNYKYAYLHKAEGEKENVLPLYKKAENILDAREQPYAMSEISKKLFQRMDLDQICRKRIDNYNSLSQGICLSEHIVIPHLLSEGEIPFYFPIYVRKRRSDFQTYLAKHKVYATVIWGCPEEFENLIDYRAKDIYREILCIPCDQRYNSEDMEYICDLINTYQFD